MYYVALRIHFCPDDRESQPDEAVAVEGAGRTVTVPLAAAWPAVLVLHSQLSEPLFSAGEPCPLSWLKLDLAFNNVKPKDRYLVLDQVQFRTELGYVRLTNQKFGLDGSRASFLVPSYSPYKS